MFIKNGDFTKKTLRDWSTLMILKSLDTSVREEMSFLQERRKQRKKLVFHLCF